MMRLDLSAVHFQPVMWTNSWPIDNRVGSKDPTGSALCIGVLNMPWLVIPMTVGTSKRGVINAYVR